MKCPQCEYQRMPGQEVVMRPPSGDYGEFYILLERVNRLNYWKDLELEDVYACPQCGSMFIAVGER
jgi:hypothetical protein